MVYSKKKLINSDTIEYDRYLINLSDNISDNLKEHDKFHIIDNYSKPIELTKATWVKDELVSICNSCNVSFSLFRRKHHCRCCGKIFCYDCTKYFINIPDINKSLKNPSDNVERVCSSCYKTILDFNHLKKMFIVISNLPLEIDEIVKLSSVSSIWNKIIEYYKSSCRRILTKKSTDMLYPNEINLLWINRNLFSGHSCWLIQLIKSMEYNCKNKQEILGILRKDKRIPCKNLFCNKFCNNKLKIDDVMFCISNTKQNTDNFHIDKYLVELISDCDYKELICYLPILISCLKYKTHSVISDKLIELSKDNLEFVSKLFWEITLQMEYENYQDFYNILRCKLTDRVSSEFKLVLKNTFYMVENLNEMSKNINNFNLHIRSYFSEYPNGISCPVNPTIKLKNVKENGIKVKGSSSKPISIKFETEDNRDYELLYKNDDIRKDLIIMNIIRLIDIILKREENLDLNIITYGVLPISSTRGFIEIVKNAETLLSINKRKKFSILNFILENNTSKSVDEIREVFTKSCAAYCILSYILGIGDRHMENIMVKETGEIFHIDFGFILGSDPKPMAPEIRITDEMIDAMGGMESRYYQHFKDLCAKAFICLRRHISIFQILFSDFSNANPPIDKKFTTEYIEKFINEKFLVGEDMNNAKLYLINKISSRTIGYSETLIDLCHQAQDDNSSIKNFTESAKYLSSSIIGYFSS